MTAAGRNNFLTQSIIAPFIACHKPYDNKRGGKKCKNRRVNNFAGALPNTGRKTKLPASALFYKSGLQGCLMQECLLMLFLNRFFRFIAPACLLAAYFNFAGAAAAQIITDNEQCRPEPERLDHLRQEQKGVFRALRLAEDSFYLGNLQFADENGGTARLADFSGKMLLVNLWGIWCPPCRAEIPDLAALQTRLGGKDFAVMTIYDYVSSEAKVRAFLAEHHAENLPLYHDPDMSFYNYLKRAGLARGLPVSLLIDARGCLIASLNGGAKWDSPEALAFIKAAGQP
ncbi:hypothetical protein DPQ22_00945 [Candidatus Tokpelaia sp.]|nr:hypothetical protein DPQ22_00945 [Candidatus Tokpelaia sp.]